MLPAGWLWALATRVRLSTGEWRLLAVYLSTPDPISVRQAARRVRLSYPFAKRLTRGLLAWGILRRLGPAALTFNPRTEEWGPPDERPPAADGSPSTALTRLLTAPTAPHPGATVAGPGLAAGAPG